MRAMLFAIGCLSQLFLAASVQLDKAQFSMDEISEEAWPGLDWQSWFGSKPQLTRVGLDKREAQVQPMLCVVVCRTQEEFKLVQYMQRQLKQCDQYVVATEKTEEQRLAQITDQNTPPPPQEEIFLQVWNSLAQRDDIETFDWIVKLDPDTFFRPAKLRLALKRYTNQPVIVAHRPNNATSLPDNAFLSLDQYPAEQNHAERWYESQPFGMFAISRKVFNVYRKAGCNVTAAGHSHEGEWWQECLSTPAFKKIRARLARPENRCVDFVWNANIYTPKNYESHRFPLSLNMTKDLLRGNAIYHEQGFCMSQNIAAFHPVRDPMAYRALQMIFEEGKSVTKSWNATAFHEVDGWRNESKVEVYFDSEPLCLCSTERSRVFTKCSQTTRQMLSMFGGGEAGNNTACWFVKIERAEGNVSSDCNITDNASDCTSGNASSNGTSSNTSGDWI